MVKCPRCGYENSASAVYCDNCAYLLSDQDGNKVKLNKRESSWNIGIGKKIVIVLGIIVIAFLLFSFVVFYWFCDGYPTIGGVSCGLADALFLVCYSVCCTSNRR